MQELIANYPDAKKITVVSDNLATHKKSSYYKFLPLQEARAIAEKLELIYTPKHGSWLNIAEIELQVLKKQCLSKRSLSKLIAKKEEMVEHVQGWQNQRNIEVKTVDWQFFIHDARIKLKRLYPGILE